MPSPHNPRRRTALGAAAGLAAMIPLAATRSGSARAAESPPTANAADERRILDVLDDVYRKHRYLSVPPEDGRLLRVLAESIGARQVVEIGTSTGYSGLWLLLALARTDGRLTTYEIDPQRHALARANFGRAGVLKFASLVPGDAHSEIARLKDPIRSAFPRRGQGRLSRLPAETARAGASRRTDRGTQHELAASRSGLRQSRDHRSRAGNHIPQHARRRRRRDAQEASGRVKKHWGSGGAAGNAEAERSTFRFRRAPLAARRPATDG